MRSLLSLYGTEKLLPNLVTVPMCGTHTTRDKAFENMSLLLSPVHVTLREPLQLFSLQTLYSVAS